MKAKLKKDKSEIYECGYVHKEGIGSKLNPMKALQKGLIGTMSDGNNSDLDNAAISIFYQAHLHPQSIIKYATKTPGWETCGDAVFAGFTKKSGIGFSSTDGSVMMGNDSIKSAGAGTYFKGFSPNMRGDKVVTITSSNGDKIEVPVQPGESLNILSVDGKLKGEEIIIDGTKDIVIELENGDADPNSKLHVQLICKLVGTKIIYDVLVTNARNTITIPKEAFKNFEGSPSPFISANTIIVNRVSEKIINHTDAGALRTISAYMDWMPLTVEGDLSKGNALTMGFDTTKTTIVNLDLTTQGDYQFDISKGTPFTSPPVLNMKNVAVASFVLRGNLEAKDISTSTGTYSTTTTETTKWFPELKDEDWKILIEKMYSDFEKSLTNDFGMNLVPLSDVTQSEAYEFIKPIQDSARQSFVEVGAGGTERILTTRWLEDIEDLGISFPADFVSERLVQELGVDAVIAVTVDLNFNFETEGLDPVITIQAFAPNVSYKTAASFFKMTANTDAVSLSESKSFEGRDGEVIYQMIKAKEFNSGFEKALKQLIEKEEITPVYSKLWQR
ncbi:MAG: hypothetical protein AB8B53_06780 [Flavobacteriales bacterium]